MTQYVCNKRLFTRKAARTYSTCVPRKVDEFMKARARLASSLQSYFWCDKPPFDPLCRAPINVPNKIIITKSPEVTRKLPFSLFSRPKFTRPLVHEIVPSLCFASKVNSNSIFLGGYAYKCCTYCLYRSFLCLCHH